MNTTDSLSTLGIVADSRILVVMPHPDDESIFCGGFLHQLSVNAIQTRVITMTVGEKSTLRYGLKPMDDLGQIREKELTTSFHVLGINDFHIYHYPDGKLEKIEEKIKKTIQKNIQEFNPTHVATLEPDGVYGHPDHVALSAFITNVVSKPTQILYITVSPSYTLPSAVWMASKKQIKPMHPDFKLKLRSTDIIAKLKSLHAHRSQFVSPITKLPFQAAFFLKNKLLSYEFFAKGN
ncbi:MAG: PIG-L family deacetylase [Candidatus Gottesmanbacteria bacterium]|nr:PIG-L family deacetylase [Candidatus Gottesmanbacteria bacterium]